jgi:hypothetical protein
VYPWARDAWCLLLNLIPRWAWLRRERRDGEADRLLGAIGRYPFQSVQVQLVRIAESGRQPELLVPGEVLRLLGEYPESRDE